MPFYLLHTAAWSSLWPFPIAVLLITILMCVCFKNNGEWRRIAWPVAALTALGLTTGYITGLSRAPAVGTVLPAVLSLLGGLALVIVGQSPAKARLVSAAILVFSGGLLLGVTWGSSTRASGDAYAHDARELMRRAHIEAQVREFRAALELPPWPAEQSKAAAGMSGD